MKQIQHEIGLDVRAALSTRAQEDNAPLGFGGWACIWGVRDTYGTIWQRGCFSAVAPLEGETFPFLWLHDRSQPIGTLTAEERDQGLWIDVTYDDGEERFAAKAKSGSADGLSVGFVPYEIDEDGLVRAVLLREVSQITRGMQSVPGSVVAEMRAAADENAPALEVSTETDVDVAARQARSLALHRLRIA